MLSRAFVIGYAWPHNARMFSCRLSERAREELLAEADCSACSIAGPRVDIGKSACWRFSESVHSWYEFYRQDHRVLMMTLRCRRTYGQF